MAKRRSALNLFLDSSVLFSAVNSSFGGSAKLFAIRAITLQASSIVLSEVEKNVRLKLGEMYLERFFRLTRQLVIDTRVPNDQEIKKAKRVIAKKDAVILAEFVRSDCSYLITLDRRDFLQDTALEYVAPKKVMTPKMFFDNTEG